MASAVQGAIALQQARCLSEPLQAPDFIPIGELKQAGRHGSHQPLWRVILAGLIGNVMEWYDFALYGYFVGIFSDQFFPSSDPNASLIAAFGAFAAGFLVRPFGGVVLGRIGDRVGRRQALTLSVMAMALATVSMAILPTYQQVGLWPRSLWCCCASCKDSQLAANTPPRLCLAEHAPANRRGLVTIWGLWGSVLGMLLGSAAGTLLSSNLSAAQMHSWGWRLPFALGLLVALTGLALRRGLHSETPAATAAPPLQDLARHRGAMLRVLLLNVASSVAFYTAFVYVITYIQSEAGRARALHWPSTPAVMGLLLIFYPIAAWISDRLGREPLLITGSLFLLLAGLPIFELLHSGNPTWITRGNCC